MAADISPIDVLSHFPILCEEKGIPYCFVKSRMLLGVAAQTKKPTSVVLLMEPTDQALKAKYTTIYEKIKAINPFI